LTASDGQWNYRSAHIAFTFIVVKDVVGSPCEEPFAINTLVFIGVSTNVKPAAL
jgi:hypothetical protein